MDGSPLEELRIAANRRMSEKGKAALIKAFFIPTPSGKERYLDLLDATAAAGSALGSLDPWSSSEGAVSGGVGFSSPESVHEEKQKRARQWAFLVSCLASVLWVLGFQAVKASQSSPDGAPFYRSSRAGPPTSAGATPRRRRPHPDASLLEEHMGKEEAKGQEDPWDVLLGGEYDRATPVRRPPPVETQKPPLSTAKKRRRSGGVIDLTPPDLTSSSSRTPYYTTPKGKLQRRRSARLNSFGGDSRSSAGSPVP
mmetsp:Transcript_14667/g.43416  ORF Transcript_14667/g.43416 Transcript_14667/m.43416 type:complete len:254 (-) Transcript_14667:104-865(-)